MVLNVSEVRICTLMRNIPGNQISLSFALHSDLLRSCQTNKRTDACSTGEKEEPPLPALITDAHMSKPCMLQRQSQCFTSMQAARYQAL